MDTYISTSAELYPLAIPHVRHHRRCPRHNADLRENHHRGDPHTRGRERPHVRQRQGPDPRQARNRRRQRRSASAAAVSRLRREATRRRGRRPPDAGRLWHRQGVDAAPGARPPRRPPAVGLLPPPHRPQPPRPRAQLQREQDDLPQVLRTPSSEVYQLPQEEVRPQQRPKAEENIGTTLLRQEENDGAMVGALASRPLPRNPL